MINWNFHLFSFSKCGSQAFVNFADFPKELILEKKATLSKAYSREVSPEILVNIKPFKEFTAKSCASENKIVTEITKLSNKRKNNFENKEPVNKCDVSK